MDLAPVTLATEPSELQELALHESLYGSTYSQDQQYVQL
jgi:hypothetical protein